MSGRGQKDTRRSTAASPSRYDIIVNASRNITVLGTQIVVELNDADTTNISKIQGLAKNTSTTWICLRGADPNIADIPCSRAKRALSVCNPSGSWSYCSGLQSIKNVCDADLKNEKQKDVSETIPERSSSTLEEDTDSSFSLW